MRTTQSTGRRLGLDVATFDVNVRAHGFETTDVQIDRPRANGATAGQGNFGFAKTRDHRAEHQDRGAHGLHQLIRSEEHTSELQSLMRISYAVFCLKKKTTNTKLKLRK